MGSSGGKTPVRDLYTETAGELKAKADLAPAVYATEAQYRPGYNALDLQSIDQLLKGIPGGERELEYTEVVTKYRNPVTGEMSDSPGKYMDPHKVGKQLNKGVDSYRGEELVPVRVPILSKKTIKTDATPGYLEIADTVADRVANIEARGLSAQRSADIADVRKLGVSSLEATQAADPRTASLIERLTTDASDELNLGGYIQPQDLRSVQQGVRSRQSGMLSGTGNSGDFQEALGLSDYAQTLRNKRRAYATGVVGLRSGVYGDAFNRVLGRPAAASPSDAMGAAYGISKKAGPTMFGSTINANDVADSNFNAGVANRNAKANNNAAMTSAGISAGAGVGAALIAALV